MCTFIIIFKVIKTHIFSGQKKNKQHYIRWDTCGTSKFILCTNQFMLAQAGIFIYYFSPVVDKASVSVSLCHWLGQINTRGCGHTTSRVGLLVVSHDSLVIGAQRASLEAWSFDLGHNSLSSEDPGHDSLWVQRTPTTSSPVNLPQR